MPGQRDVLLAHLLVGFARANAEQCACARIQSSATHARMAMDDVPCTADQIHLLVCRCTLSLLPRHRREARCTPVDVQTHLGCEGETSQPTKASGGSTTCWGSVEHACMSSHGEEEARQRGCGVEEHAFGDLERLVKAIPPSLWCHLGDRLYSMVHRCNTHDTNHRKWHRFRMGL